MKPFGEMSAGRNPEYASSPMSVDHIVSPAAECGGSGDGLAQTAGPMRSQYFDRVPVCAHNQTKTAKRRPVFASSSRAGVAVRSLPTRDSVTTHPASPTSGGAQAL